MKILGLASNYHDSSATLIINGEVIASAAEERFTREKHDPSFPNFAINFCLEKAGIDKSEIDFIAYHEDPISKFSRNLSSTMLNWPKSRSIFIHAMKEMITSGFWIRHEIAKKIDIHPKKISYIPHHMSHAAHTFLTSPFEKAAVLTLDAVGEWASTGIFFGDKSKRENAIATLEIVPFPSSLGLVYSAFTGFLGFKVNSGESSTMALAAFGKPKYESLVREVIKIIPEGTFSIDLSYFDFSKVDDLPLTEKFFQIFGEARSYKSKFPFSCLEKTDIISQSDQKYADIAASIQVVLEETILHLATRAKQLTGSSNLCIAGGVALNCVANTKLLESGIFENIYCPPDPGDGGGAMGAALYLSMKKGDFTAPKKLSAYLGEEQRIDQLESMLQHLDPADWHRYSRLAIKPMKKENLKVYRFKNEDELIKKTSELIFAKKIVGWVQGRFENGPRALGARSILIDPSDVLLAKRLSTQVKLRAPFRPYACSLTEEAAKQCLIYPFDREPLLAKWMLCALPVEKSAQSQLMAAMHVDNTTRAQIVQKEDNPLFHKLITEFGKQKGLAAILNTSFNESGFPIVNTPTEALIAFSRTFMDVLIVEDLLIERVFDA